jgi:alpha-amylase
MHGLDMQPIISETDFLAFSRGDQGMVVLNKSQQVKTLTVDGNETLTDLLSGKQFVAVEQKLHIEIPSRQSYLLVKGDERDN